MQNILQIKNLLDLVEYSMKDGFEIEFMLCGNVPLMNISINNPFLEISFDFLHK